MTTWGGLSSLFEQPIPKNPSLIESLSPWNQIIPEKPDDATCFTEIFGELHFREKPAPPPPEPGNGGKASSSAYLPAKNSDKLQLCTERLGSESSDGGVEDLPPKEIDDGHQWTKMTENTEAESFPLSGADGEVSGFAGRSYFSYVGAKSGGFPPPLSSIRRSGKLGIYFKSSREEGRFVLRKVKIPTQEILHASREDGRLKLQLVHPKDHDGGEDDEEEEDDDNKELPAIEDNEDDRRS